VAAKWIPMHAFMKLVFSWACNKSKANYFLDVWKIGVKVCARELQYRNIQYIPLPVRLDLISDSFEAWHYQCLD
jgi:hypothetical protein